MTAAGPALRLFEGGGPRVFNASAGRGFADDFARGVLQRLRAAGGDALDLAEIDVVVSTRRAIRSLRRAFAEASGGAALGPRLYALGDVDQALGPDAGPAAPDAPLLDAARAEDSADVDLFAASGAPHGAPKAAGPLSRLLFLTDLVRALLRHAPELGAPTAAPALARDLAALLDSAQAADVSLEAIEAAIEADGGAAHWANSARFLDLARQAWPARLAELGRIDPWERRRRLIEQLAATWAQSPPQRTVIVAGSTGSLGVSARFIALAAASPDGAVVLPGLDADLDAEGWAAAAQTPEHPQAGLSALLSRLGVDRDAVRPWLADAQDGPGAAARRARGQLLSEAMQPAPVTDAWMGRLGALGALAEAATAGLTLVEAPTPRDEAAAIACALREALETPRRRAALVTPDRSLARRVSGELARWGISADDSSGRPLGLTPPGVFFRAALEAAMEDFAPAALLSLLKHPFCAAGSPRGLAARQARRLERDVLRGRRGAVIGLEALAAAIADRDAEEAAIGERSGEARTAPPLAPWFGGVADALGPLAARFCAEEGAPLSDWLDAHRRTAEALAADDAGDSALYDKPAGEALRGFLDKLAAEAAGAGAGDLDAADYAALLGGLIGAEAVREPYGRHARVKILGPLEARMLSSDLVVVAGLIEGVWPKTPEPDAWISRDMRAALGLPPLESRIGLSAHDFVQAASAPEVILTRSLRQDGAPTTPSRWLTRLTTLLGGAAPDRLLEMRARGAPWLRLAGRLDAPDTAPSSAQAPAPRPLPKPPLEARPTAFSVTDVERLIRDPYAIYARKVLRLRPVPPLADAPDARDRGELLHELVERFVSRSRGGLPEDAEALFDRLIEETFAPVAAWPTISAFWRARAASLKPGFLRDEAQRRETGRPVALEASGFLQIDTPFGEAQLRATADRIDAVNGPDGAGYALYDYKSGRAPSPREIEFFAKQLPLEAAILREAGFVGAPRGPVLRMAFLTLSGGGGARLIKGDPEALAAAALDGFQRLFGAYARPEQGYLSRSRPQFLKYEGDYDHLARYGEWSDGGDEADA